jgi:hypothetical protein
MMAQSMNQKGSPGPSSLSMMNLSESLVDAFEGAVHLSSEDAAVLIANVFIPVSEDQPEGGSDRAIIKGLAMHSHASHGRDATRAMLAETAQALDSLGLTMAAVLDLGPLPVQVADGAAIERTWAECAIVDLLESLEANAAKLGQVYSLEQAQHILSRRMVIVMDRKRWKMEAAILKDRIDDRVAMLKTRDPELAALVAAHAQAESGMAQAERNLVRWTSWYWGSLKELMRDVLGGKTRSWACPFGKIRKRHITRRVLKGSDPGAMPKMVAWAKASGHDAAIDEELKISRVPKDALDQLGDDDAIQNGFALRPEGEEIELVNDGEDEK